MGQGLQAAPAAMFSARSPAVLQVEVPCACWDLANSTERRHKAWCCILSQQVMRSGVSDGLHGPKQPCFCLCQA